MLSVLKAEYLNKYKLKIKFDDNSEGVADFENILRSDNREVFKELLDLEKFNQFKIDYDTIVWENGLDLAPEFLYHLIKEK